MTLGTGIFASTLLIVLALAIWQTTKHRRWKVIGKVAIVSGAICGLVALGLWGWTVYRQRPERQTVLAGIAIGMTPIDVQIAKGAPNLTRDFPASGAAVSDSPPDAAPAPVTTRQTGNPFNQFDPPPKPDAIGQSSKETKNWLFVDEKYEGNEATIVVFGKVGPSMKVSIVCRHNSHDSVLGLTQGMTEAQVIGRLGAPSFVSIQEDGRSKMMSYGQWNVAFEIEKGTVADVCISDHPVRYRKEYSPT